MLRTYLNISWGVVKFDWQVEDNDGMESTPGGDGHDF